MSAYSHDLTQLWDRHIADRDSWALALARFTRKEVDSGGTYPKAFHETLRWYVERFEEAEQRVSLSADMRALEVYGVFASKVTLALVRARLSVPGDAAVAT